MQRASGWVALLLGAFLLAHTGCLATSNRPAGDGGELSEAGPLVPIDDAAVGTFDATRRDGPSGPRSDGGPARPDTLAQRLEGGPAKSDSAVQVTIPDPGPAQVNCSTAKLGNLAKAKEIYDQTFGSKIPQNEAGWGWHVDPAILTPQHPERIAFYPPPAGLADATLHNYFDFNPTSLERTTTRTNWELFGGFNPQSDRAAPYRRFNPKDFIPATATHYSRDEPTNYDLMAIQFVYRLACYPTQMKEALQRCGGCDDVWTALSKNDLYKISEVRFVRVKNNQFEVSRLFRFISVDASGDMAGHAAENPFFFGTVGGKSYYAKWRGETSGLVALRSGHYMKANQMLIRYSYVNK
ncbi:MAG: hypothetical protein IT371_21865 [Deltaproteobacteria bacterium]|nr:hypothetical protein [Deltaproteobacteria bacterium]